MGIVQSCLALIQVGKRKEAEELMQIYKMTKEINTKSKINQRFYYEFLGNNMICIMTGGFMLRFLCLV